MLRGRQLLADALLLSLPQSLWLTSSSEGLLLVDGAGSSVGGNTGINPVIWPDFCSALIVGRLAPLGLHDTRFRSVPVSCSPRTGADASSPRHETHRNVANSRSLKSWKGLRRQTSSVLYAPSALSAMALPYESPTVPVEGIMPNSPTLVVYTRLMYCAPWSLLNRCRFNSD